MTLRSTVLAALALGALSMCSPASASTRGVFLANGPRFALSESAFSESLDSLGSGQDPAPSGESGLSTAQLRILRAINARHGLPAGVPVPSWALEPGQHAYFTASPNDLYDHRSSTASHLGSTLEEPTETAGEESEPGREPGEGNELGVRSGKVPPIRFMGGVVQHQPKLDVVFWGSNWQSAANQPLYTQLLKYFEGLSGSSEQGILTQYFDATGYISSSVTVKSMVDTRVTAPTGVNSAALEAEVRYAETAMEPNTANTQYTLLTAPGTTYEEAFANGYCAFHDVSAGAVYTFVPYSGDEPFSKKANCVWYGDGNAGDATNVMASHEYAESATDPLWDTSAGWRNLQNPNGEIGDICATPGAELANGSFVQQWYDDHQNVCSLSDQNPPHVLAISETASINNVTKREATINATVNPENLATTYQFEYGLTNSYGSQLPAIETTAGTAQANVAESQTISGLSPETTYHYRVVAKNSSGTTYGEDRTVIPSVWSVQPSHESSWGESWLRDVSCGTPSTCMAVGYYYQGETEGNKVLTLQLKGGRWSGVSVPSNAGESYPELAGVSCVSGTMCMAVGGLSMSSGLQPMIARWSGSAWSREYVTLPGGSVGGELYDVSCPSESECLAVGAVKSSAGVWSNYSAVWSGGKWASLTTPTSSESTLSETRAVSCPAGGWCMAAGWYNTGHGTKPFTMSLNAGAWTFQSRTSYDAFFGIDCVSKEFCMTADRSGTAEEWNGSSWTQMTMPTLTDVKGAFFEGIDCQSTAKCTIVGGGYSNVAKVTVTLVENWNGTSWTEQATPRESERAGNWFYGVSCVGSETCVTVGLSAANGAQQSLLETRDGLAAPSLTTTFGSSGSGAGQFAKPNAAATDAKGDVWVSDKENARIDEFNSKGEFVETFGWEVNKTKVEAAGTQAEKNLCTAASGNVCQAGKPGSLNGQLSTPLGLAFASEGNMWVAEAGSDRVQEFNVKGEYVSKFGSEGAGAGQFIEPWGVAVSPEGNIWVSDARYYRVEEFSSAGAFIREVHGAGQGGAGNAEFSSPRGIAIDSAGNVWVADDGNHRIQELSSTGGYLNKFGSQGSGEGQMSEPFGIAIRPSGNILVAERNTANRLQILTPRGEYVTEHPAEGESRSVAVGPGGVEYLVGNAYGKIQKLESPAPPEDATSAAASVGGSTATLKGTVNPGGLATTYYFEYGTSASYGTIAPVPAASAGSGADAVAVSQAVSGLLPEATYHFRVVAVNAEGVKYGADLTFITQPLHLLTFGSSGSGAGQMNKPQGVVTDAGGDVWVSDNGNARIDEFNSKGEFVETFGWEVNKTKVEAAGTQAEKNLCTAASGNVCQAGKSGNLNGQLSAPVGLAFTAGGNLWVAEIGNDRVQEFNVKGEYISKFGSEGTGAGQFSEPWGMAISPGGNIWVSDARYYRVEEFSSAGAFIREVHGAGQGGAGNAEFSSPRGIAIDSAGNVWVADDGNHRIQELSSTGGYLNKFGSQGSGEGQMSEPFGIAVKPSGDILVVERNTTNRLQVFTALGAYLTQYTTEGETRNIGLGAEGLEYIAGNVARTIQKLQGG